MFTEFFYLLRAYGVPVTVTEWLTFMEALAGGLVAASLNDFYAVGRAIMVKSEAFFDQYDQAFQHAFQGIEIPQEIADQVWEWLRDPLALPGLSEEEQRALLQQFGAIDLDELRRLFEERLAALEKAGCKERVDHRTLKEQGIEREPAPKISVAASATSGSY